MKFSQEISIFKPHAIEYEVVSLGSRITQTAGEIRLETDQKLTNYSTTIEMNAAISVLPHTITLGVNGTAGKDTGASISVSLYDANGNLIDASSGNIYIDGEVIFSSQLTDGTTLISGSNIKTGTIQGASLILGGQNNQNGTISMRNSSGTEVGTWTNSGLTITNPTTLRTSLNTDGQLHVYRYSNSQFREMGTLGKYTITRNGRTYNVIGLNALRENVDGLALVINGNPYYAINASQDPHGGMDFTGYGFRHYFDGDTYCEGTYKTANGYGWGGQGDVDDPIVYTAASVRIEEWDGHGHFYAAASMSTGGNCFAADFINISDERAKQNIAPIETSDAHALIMGLKPVSFEFKKKPEKVHHGFIAQDVIPLVPEDSAVINETPDGMLGLAYTDLIADLVAVIQEQDKRITELERRNANGNG